VTAGGLTRLVLRVVCDVRTAAAAGGAPSAALFGAAMDAPLTSSPREMLARSDSGMAATGAVGARFPTVTEAMEPR